MGSKKKGLAVEVLAPWARLLWRRVHVCNMWVRQWVGMELPLAALVKTLWLMDIAESRATILWIMTG